MKYQASCHCGAVCAEVEADEHLVAHACNCSICKITGLQQVIVPARNFKMIRGEDKLNLYQFNQHIAKHYFCKICGVKPFYVPRSNPDGFAVNVHALSPEPKSIRVETFDGVNWEKNAASLADFSK